jgi:hypothetical protein
MAKIYYSNYPAYVSAFNKVQKLSTRLYGMPGYGNGLDNDLLRAATENEGAENSTEYKRIKKIFDDVYKQYIVADNNWKTIRKQITDEVTAKRTKEETKKQEEKNAKVIKNLKIQRDQAKRINDSEGARELQNQINALTNKKGTDTTGDSNLPENQFNSLDAAGFGTKYTVVYNPKSNTQSLVDGGNNDAFVYTDSSNAVTITTNFSEIQKKIIADAQATPGGINGLFADLYEKNLISRETFNKKDLSADDLGRAMFYVTQEYSKQTWSDYTYNNKKQSSDFFDWFDSIPKRKGTGDGNVTRRVDITLRQDSDKDINEFFVQTLGRPATAIEKENYFTALNNAEKKAIETTRSSGSTLTTTGENLTETDKLFIKGKVAGNAIKGTDIDTILSAGGDAADNINTIVSYASRNGLNWTKQEATSAVADAYRNGKTMDNIKSKIKNLSKFKYQNLSTLLSENDDIDIYDLGQSYGSLKSQILELGDAQYSVFDPDIQAALSNNGKPGLMTETEFRQILKKKPEWGKTRNAREEAANYANDILRSFGLMA